MNELIAMWEARANNENNSDVALAIMQCVGELKAIQEPNTYSTLKEFTDVVNKDDRVWIYEYGLDSKGGYTTFSIILKGVIQMRFDYKLYNTDTALMGYIVQALQNNDETAIQLLRKVVA